MDRAHRLGQTKVVNVYRLITKGTLEEKIMGYVCSDFICSRSTHSRVQFATLQVEHRTLCGDAAKCRVGYYGHQPRPGPIQTHNRRRRGGHCGTKEEGFRPSSFTKGIACWAGRLASRGRISGLGSQLILGFNWAITIDLHRHSQTYSTSHQYSPFLFKLYHSPTPLGFVGIKPNITLNIKRVTRRV